MPNILTNGGLETDAVALTGYAERSTAQAYDGSYSLRMRTIKGIGGITPDGRGICEWPAFAMDVGETYTVTLRYDSDQAAHATLLDPEPFTLKLGVELLFRKAERSLQDRSDASQD